MKRLQVAANIAACNMSSAACSGFFSNVARQLVGQNASCKTRFMAKDLIIQHDQRL